VELATRPPGHADWTARIAARYTDPSAGRRVAEIDDLLVRLTPASILARTEIGLP
jgi:hypothetical protein